MPHLPPLRPRSDRRQVGARCRTGSLLLLALLLLPGAVPLQGEWLVTRDGQKIATDGPYRVEGRRVLYRNSTGNLAAIRVTEVDLEASAHANRVDSDSRTFDFATPKTGPEWNEKLLTLEETREALAVPSAESGTPDGKVAPAEPLAPAAARTSASGGDGLFASLGLDLEQELGALDRRYDLSTETGMRRAAGELMRLARLVEMRAEDATEPTEPLLRELVEGLGSLAELARKDPAQAARRYRGQSSVVPSGR